MLSEKTFSPNWASKPGNTILAAIEYRNWSLEEFAETLGKPRDVIFRYINGTRGIDPAFAESLSKVLGGSERFWLNRQANYEESRDRVWANGVPLESLQDLGNIFKIESLDDRFKTCLEFFAVTSHCEWESRYSNALTAFRSSSTYQSSAIEVATWLRLGEILAEQLSCGAWNPNGLESSLTSIRALTRVKDPRVFIPRLQAICLPLGVAVVVVKSPRGCKASGAARFVAPEKAMVLLSGRHLSDDHFWFTFFHEVGHLLLHGKERIFIDEETSDTSDVKEKEANAFAQEHLIPPEFRDEFSGLGYNSKKVIRFAKEVGIAPGIVVGQLQHFGLIPRSHLNKLKRQYAWDSAGRLCLSP